MNNNVNDFFNQLIGTWQFTEKQSFEKWTYENDEFSAIVFSIIQNDTVISETIRLIVENGDVFYEPTVKNQNNALPVRFKMKELNSDETSIKNIFLFSTKGHENIFSGNSDSYRNHKTKLLTKIYTCEITFENPEHDFPQSINYKIISENNLKATICGILEEDELAFDFDYTRKE